MGCDLGTIGTVRSGHPGSEKILPPPVVSSLGRDRRDWVTPSEKTAVVEGKSREKSVDACCRVGLVSLREDLKSTATGTVGTHASRKLVEPGVW
eukprot:scaffold408_cov347-Pavlova_lutheri.AAC.19